MPSPPPAAARAQLARVYDLMFVEGKPGAEEVTFAETTFAELAGLLELLPDADNTDLLFRLSEGVAPIKIAELFNILIWSADARGIVDPEVIQEWFYGKQARRVEVAARVDLFPSNSMDESERIIGLLRRRFPQLDHVLQPLLREVTARMREEKAWSDYRRDTFEMPKELTPSILEIIENIKSR